MIALVMAGGKGTRMKMSGEKLLLHHKKPIILHVIEALEQSKCFSKILAATSPNSPNTEKLVSEHVGIIKTKGEGYVSDLNYALSGLDEPVFVVSGDLPLLDYITIQGLVSKYEKNAQWQSFVVTKKFLDQNNLNLEFSTITNGEKCYYTGISIVNPKSSNQETCTIYNDAKIAVNLNTKEDYSKIPNTVP
jgi:adenosylcobinamide-phosphate guanylyltransferase